VAGHFAHRRVVVQFRVFVRVGVRFEGEHAVVFLLNIVMGLSPHIPHVAGKRGNGGLFPCRPLRQGSENRFYPARDR
jgi:hypothetical protein